MLLPSFSNLFIQRGAQHELPSSRVQHVDLLPCGGKNHVWMEERNSSSVAQMKTLIITVLFRCRVSMEIRGTILFSSEADRRNMFIIIV